MTLNRAQRRASKSFYTKEMRSAIFDKFEDMTPEFLAIRQRDGKSNKYVYGMKKNSIYSVQMFKYDKIYVLGLRRHDEKPMNSWRHAQMIKDELLGSDFFGVQIFPKERDLIDQANMYWIFCSNGEMDQKYNLGNYPL